MTVFTTAQWRQLGHSDRTITNDIDAGQLLRLRRGFVARPEGLEYETLHLARIEAAAPLLSDGTYIAHESAAVLHRLPLRHDPGPRVRVIRTGGGHGYRNRVLHARAAPLSDAEGALVDGIRVTSIERTVIDLARRLSFPEGVMLADAALARGASLGLMAEIAAGGRGGGRARGVLEFADARSESPGESLSRALMFIAGLPAPELQVELWDARGRFVARVDFLWRRHGLVGEFDGLGKYAKLRRPGETLEDVVRREKSRDAALHDLGWRTCHWIWDDLGDAGTMAARWRRALGVS